MSMNKVKVISKSTQRYGIIFKFRIEEKTLKIIFTNHALQRMKRWDLKSTEVINALIFAEEVVIGHGKRFIAHKTKNKHLIRVIYEYEKDAPKIITVYSPDKSRYFQGGGKYADKILP